MDSGGAVDPVASGANLLSLAATYCAASGQYLLKLEPGTYDLNGGTLGLCPNFDVEGSGEDVTNITSSGPPTVSDAHPSFASVGEVRLLTITNINTAGGPCVSFDPGVFWRLRHVTLNMISAIYANGIYVNAPGIMDHVTINVAATKNTTGLTIGDVAYTSTTPVEIADSTINVSGGTGIYLWAGAVYIHNTTVSAGPSGSGGTGISVSSGTATVFASRLLADTTTAGLPAGVACYFSLGYSGPLNSTCN